ncbi:MAG: hypothetical protein ABIH36_00255 [bacterium]
MSTSIVPAALSVLPPELQGRKIILVEVCLGCRTRKVYFEGHQPNMRPTNLVSSWKIPPEVDEKFREYIQTWNCLVCKDNRRFDDWPEDPPH